jgi:hypothetical protein
VLVVETDVLLKSGLVLGVEEAVVVLGLKSGIRLEAGPAPGPHTELECDPSPLITIPDLVNIY